MFKIITGLLIAISCYAADTPFDNTRAEAYSYAEIKEAFEPILHPDVKEIFFQLTPVFWIDGFGKSPHGAKGLVDCWNCYYGSLKAFLGQENAANLQLQEIFHRMGDHAGRVYRVAPDLYPALQALEIEMRELFPENEDVLWNKLPVFDTATDPASDTSPAQQTYLEIAAEMFKGALFWLWR